jgi:hypothetical protein
MYGGNPATAPATNLGLDNKWIPTTVKGLGIFADETCRDDPTACKY